MAWNGKFSANQKRETLKSKVSVKLKQCRVILTSYIVTLFKSARTDTDFARSIIKKRRVTMPVKKYESCKFILPTSDLVERFFSSAGYALSDLRNRLLPSNLELQLFLKVNKRFWDKKTVQNAMNFE